MAKNHIWQKLGQPEPPIRLGMYEYGTVWTPDTIHPKQGVRYHLNLGWWSYKTWAIKLYKEARGIKYGKVKDQPVS